jgi:uncharacterized protein (DUF362 family)
MSKASDDRAMTRRDFLSRATKAGAAIAATGVVGYWLYDRTGPKAQTVTDLVSLPDFSLPAVGRKMSIITGSDRVKTIDRAFAALGGVEQFIRKGDRVLLKVNAAFASAPALGATVHPQLVAEVIRLCVQAGAASVTVTDNPINDPPSCFRLTGIAEAVQKAGARLVLPQESFFQPTTVPGGALIKNWPLLYEPFRGINKLIGIAPVKDHHRSGASMSIKNWYGLMGGRRNIFHQDIHNIIKELAMMVSPTLVILDGTTTMMANGPTGGSLDDLKQTNTMIVSTDQVAADSFGATLLGKTAASLPFIRKAAEAGRGTMDYESLNPARDHVE